MKKGKDKDGNYRFVLPPVERTEHSCICPECVGFFTLWRSYGYCRAHFRNYMNHKSPLIRHHAQRPKECLILGCYEPHWEKGMCEPHWKEWKENERKFQHMREQNDGFIPIATECMHPECHLPIKTREMCQKHYDEQRKRSLAND